MKISDIRIRIMDREDSKLKAFASITIEDCFVIHDIKLIDGKRGLYIAMPSKVSPDGNRKDIVHPIKSETRSEIEEKVIEAYNNALNAPKE